MNIILFNFPNSMSELLFFLFFRIYIHIYCFLRLNLFTNLPHLSHKLSITRDPFVIYNLKGRDYWKFRINFVLTSDELIESCTRLTILSSFRLLLSRISVFITITYLSYSYTRPLIRRANRIYRHVNQLHPADI